MDDPTRTGPYQPATVGEVATELPRRIGRYRVEGALGQGGFGVVYLALDEQLQRLVAIKVPHRQLVARPEDAEAYLTEARTVAHLDHPHIVPVFDVGSTDQFPCFVVSKYVEGSTLAGRIKAGRPSVAEAVGLVATVAETLHHAHRRGVVHRDVKPGNILLDKGGTPYVADFGLALREQDMGLGPRYAGTAAYMSPEQARGEGHRVDGRSDVFSLGAVLYEPLAGRRPFRAGSQAELLEQVANHEPRPLRQLDEAVPKELERVCFKALAKRASERYMTAKDMADDLRHFLAEQTVDPPSGANVKGVAAGSATEVMQPPSTSAASSRSGASSATVPTSYGRPVTIVPKGLRSFDAHDADFFLELLPGPRDRAGLPDGIHFWKTRIEETDADGTFTVGLLYGPSGCGKSSLVKAGLLPRLSDDVIAVYVEATAEETEARLLSGLRKRCPTLPAGLGLKETLAALRRGQGAPAGKKVLLVLDQFEQWLHARKEETCSELVQALRQCDGRRVQCVVLTRDDFWLAVSRFLRELEVRLLEGQNSALVDLFDTDHARKVLAAFGRAFGRLPEDLRETGKEQKEFLKKAVSGLAQGGKVVCVRLALFAEMMKGKPWTPASLKAVGGTEGVGITFLEETFSAATAPPAHRYHQQAARAVLKALLPEAGADIKGHMRSQRELLEASGYGNRPKDFAELVGILDGEIRLITPTDPEGKDDADPSAVRAGAQYYQLTHDYLVHSVREWLTRKQKETRRGRAELLLADRAAVWGARPEGRQLPSPWQWLQIRWLTRQQHWTAPQRKMMRKAGRYHAARGLALGAVLLALGTAGWMVRGGVVEQQKASHAEGLVRRLLDADVAQVPGIVSEIEPYRQWADRLLRDENDKAAANSREKLHTSLALLPVGPGQADYLYGRLLDAAPQEVSVIRDSLAPRKDELLDKLWAVAEAPEKGKEAQRLRAAAALAKYDPESERWGTAGALVVNDLVLENPVFLGLWSEAFRPVKKSFLVPLSDIFRDRNPERASERMLATNLLADYTADSPQVLADLLAGADAKQFAVIFPKLKEQGEQGWQLLAGEIDRKLPADVPSSDEEREKLAKRQANAAVALLKMNRPEKVWPLLRRTPPDDPRVRSYLIHRLGSLGADAGALIKRLAEEPDITVRRALLLSLGELNEKELPPASRTALLPKLQTICRTDADPGLHAAAEWLLRAWKQGAWLEQVNGALAADREQRAKRLEGIGQLVQKEQGKAPPQWYVNGQGQTMVVVPGPVEFVMGSPVTEARRRDQEVQHRRRIARTFALAATPVTKEQFLRFRPAFTHELRRFPEPTCPIGGVDWYEAAAYCNWLSKEEGIAEDQWCYEITGQVTKLKKDYLSLRGYRLPTEAEMEYATRAGAVTARYFGETDDLLPRYAWYDRNSQERTWPVGSKKPNDLGLFDVQGNMLTWCQESYKAYPQGKEATDDKEDGPEIVGTVGRLLRGGSFLHSAVYVRSAFRDTYAPSLRVDNVGVRPARTFSP